MKAWLKGGLIGIMIIVFIIVIVIVLGLFFYLGKSSSDSSNEEILEEETDQQILSNEIKFEANSINQQIQDDLSILRITLNQCVIECPEVNGDLINEECYVSKCGKPYVDSYDDFLVPKYSKEVFLNFFIEVRKQNNNRIIEENHAKCVFDSCRISDKLWNKNCVLECFNKNKY